MHTCNLRAENAIDKRNSDCWDLLDHQSIKLVISRFRKRSYLKEERWRMNKGQTQCLVSIHMHICVPILTHHVRTYNSKLLLLIYVKYLFTYLLISSLPHIFSPTLREVTVKNIPEAVSVVISTLLRTYDVQG